MNLSLRCFMYLISPSSPEPHWWLSACSLSWIQPHNEFLLSGSKEHRTITDALLFKKRESVSSKIPLQLNSDFWNAQIILRWRISLIIYLDTHTPWNNVSANKGCNPTREGHFGVQMYMALAGIKQFFCGNVWVQLNQPKESLYRWFNEFCRSSVVEPLNGLIII